MIKIKNIACKNLVKVVEDGLMTSRGRGEGRFLPILLLDTSARPDIDELLLAHENLPPGDALSTWLSLPSFRVSIALHLHFIKPMDCEFAIVFDPEEHAMLIDSILYAQGLYLLSGKCQDKITTAITNVKVLVEVPRSAQFLSYWEKILPKVTARRFRDRGLNRQEARVAAQEVIRNMREMWAFRANMKHRNGRF